MKTYAKILSTSVILVTANLFVTQQAFSAPQCVTLPSSCAFNFDLKINKGKDKCEKSLLGVTVEAWTGPAGKKNVAPHPTFHGWKLLVDYKNRRDYWRSSGC